MSQGCVLSTFLFAVVVDDVTVWKKLVSWVSYCVLMIWS